MIEFLSMEIEWKFQVLVTCPGTWEAKNTWLASEIWEVSICQPLASALTPQIWSQRSMDTGRPVGCGKLDCCLKNHICGVRKKTQTHSPLWLDGSGEAEERRVWNQPLDLETLPSFLYYWILSQSIVYQMGCDIMAYSLDQATHMLIPGEVVSSFLIWRGETCYMSS